MCMGVTAGAYILTLFAVSCMLLHMLTFPLYGFQNLI